MHITRLCFAKWILRLEAGDIERLKRAVSAYDHAEAGDLPVFRAMDAMKEKKDVVGTIGDGR